MPHKDRIRDCITFQNEKLYIFNRRLQTILVVRPWPILRAYKLEKNSKNVSWQCCRPFLSISAKIIGPPWHYENFSGLSTRTELWRQLKLPYSHSKPIKNFIWQNSIDSWFAVIPPQYRGIVSQFAYRQWHCLSLLKSGGLPAFQLAQNNPALFWAVASSWIFSQKYRRMRDRVRLLKSRQRQIIEELSLGPATQSSVNILKKISTSAIYKGSLETLSQADPETLKYLWHCPKINKGVLLCCIPIRISPNKQTKLCHYISPWVLTEMQNQNNDEAVNLFRILWDTLIMMDVAGYKTDSYKFYNIRQINQKHDELAERFGHENSIKESEIIIPEPPVPGIPDQIIPLTTYSDIKEESIRQHNCLAAAYIYQIVSGIYYAYRVVFLGQRGTVGIQKNNNGVWEIDQLKLIYNGQPPASMVDFVNKWLLNYRILPLPHQALDFQIEGDAADGLFA